MDHIVCLDQEAKEFENLRSGSKTMIIRRSMGRKKFHYKLNERDTLYFFENSGDKMIKAKASIQHIFTSGQLSIEESKQLVDSFSDKLLLDSCLKKRFRGKRYLVLITVKDFEEIEPFKFDNSEFLNMDDWLPVGEIANVEVGSWKSEVNSR